MHCDWRMALENRLSVSAAASSRRVDFMKDSLAFSHSPAESYACADRHLAIGASGSRSPPGERSGGVIKYQPSSAAVATCLEVMSANHTTPEGTLFPWLRFSVV